MYVSRGDHSSGEVPFFLDRGPKRRDEFSPATFLPYEEGFLGNVRMLLSMCGDSKSSEISMEYIADRESSPEVQ